MVEALYEELINIIESLNPTCVFDVVEDREDEGAFPIIKPEEQGKLPPLGEQIRARYPLRAHNYYRRPMVGRSVWRGRYKAFLDRVRTFIVRLLTLRPQKRRKKIKKNLSIWKCKLVMPIKQVYNGGIKYIKWFTWVYGFPDIEG